MPHHFHDTNGWLIVGIDMHAGLHWPVPLPVNMIPMNFWELNVMHPFIMGPNTNATVLFNGVESVKDQHNPLLLWPHFPFAPDPLNLLFPLDLLFGSQKCWLPRMSVMAEGKPTAPVCIWSAVSINMDCFMFTKAPVSLIVQPGTVETTPSLGDYAFGLGRAAIELAIDAIFYALTGGFAKKPVPRGHAGRIARANWRSVRQNLGEIASNPRIRQQAWNRFKKEALSKVIPRQWDPKSRSWQWKPPADIAKWGLDQLGVSLPGVGGTAAGTDLLGSPSSLLPEAGKPFDPVDTGRKVAEGLFPPLKLFR